MDQWNCTLDHKACLLWGHLKSVVYANCLWTTEPLKECIQEEYDKISTNILHAVAESAKHQVYNCKAFNRLQSEYMAEKAYVSGIVTLCITFLPEIPYILC
jgi:hypothetical protein